MVALNAFQTLIYLVLIKACLLFYSYLFNIIIDRFLSVSIIGKYFNEHNRITTIFIYDDIKKGQINGILVIATKNPFACCYLINIDFVLPHTARFDKSLILPFLSYSPFSLYTLNSIATLFYN